MPGREETFRPTIEEDFFKPELNAGTFPLLPVQSISLYRPDATKSSAGFGKSLASFPKNYAKTSY
jgi:hypothetical protein